MNRLGTMYEAWREHPKHDLLYEMEASEATPDIKRFVPVGCATCWPEPVVQDQ